MRVKFEIEYRAAEGEMLILVNQESSILMVSHDREWWSAEEDMELQKYHYEVWCGDELSRVEPIPHTLCESPREVTICHDRWQDREESRPLTSSLFTKALFQRKSPQSLNIPPSTTTIIECRCAGVQPSQSIGVVGDGQLLGEWGSSRIVEMSDEAFPVWRVALPNVERHSEFKFVLMDRASGQILEWEEGDNRLAVPYRGEQGGESTLDIVNCSTPRFNTPQWRGLGVAIPVFSIRTDRSAGVGDFADLRAMVDWAVDREMSVIQILPINDTIMGGTWEDSYPYNSNSTIALHPQYLSVEELGRVADDTLRESFESRARELNALSQIDYAGVMTLKMEWLRELFTERNPRERGYREFVAENSWWLDPYVLFSHLRDVNGTPDFREWGSDGSYAQAAKAKRSKASQREMEFYRWLQYHLHRQLHTTAEYARSRGVALKGDIPIGVSPTSVDVWQSPELFHTDMQAGAPPDPFSDMGQNWGFPTYNWERMAEDGYAWWRRRFAKMEEYFDAFRIDHILGFFRIWEIPMSSVQGLLGHFNPALPLSRDEITARGFDFEERFTKPYVTDAILLQSFAECDPLMLKEVKIQYLTPSKGGGYNFKRQYNTQRKIVSQLEPSPLRDALVALHNEVLFVEDGTRKGCYHPRILGAKSMAYAALDSAQRSAFDAIHDDFYYSRHDQFWRDSAMRKLPLLIDSTSMMVCGEDLGMIPNCVASVMSELEILSLEIERMPKGIGVLFGTPATYPYLSISTTSTHDMSTIRGWWREDREQTRRYHGEVLQLAGEAAEECSGDVARRIVERHIDSGSILTILPWQDWMSSDEEFRNPDVDGERINVPAFSRHYWRYRMHLTLR